MDANMPRLSKTKWEKIVDSFYEKYSTLKKWQDNNFKQVCRRGTYSSFTGRKYVIHADLQSDGTYKYSRPSVCNYIVQGTSTGDIVPLAMCQLYNWIHKMNYLDVKFINQVHDSIVLDCPGHLVEEVAHKCKAIFEALPESIEKVWGYKWTVPMTGEVKAGRNWSDMKKVC